MPKSALTGFGDFASNAFYLRLEHCDRTQYALTPKKIFDALKTKSAISAGLWVFDVRNYFNFKWPTL